jgi:hypothetical protein
MKAKNQKAGRFPPIFTGRQAMSHMKAAAAKKSGSDAFKKLMAQNKETK